MHYRLLGTTGIRVSEIGFGTWGIGGLTEGATSYGETDDQVSLAALHRALDLGITFFDTSSTYGYGHAEELLGKAFGARRDKVVIGTKAGCVRHGGPYDVSPHYLRSSLEESLRWLRMEYVDLYQIHSVPMEIARRYAVTETLESLKREGKIRAFGYSTKNPEDAIEAMDVFKAEVVQVNFNLMDHRAIHAGVLQRANELKVGVIARTPFSFGFLTGKIDSLDFNERDHRSAWPKEQLERWQAAADRFAFLNSKGMYTKAQLALKFCVSFPEVSTVVPGMMRLEEVEENARTADLPPLTGKHLAAAIELRRTSTFFIGK